MAAPGPVGPHWFGERSGMPLIQLTPLSGRSLSFSEREIALLRAQQVPVREIARQLARAPSTISRKLRRNAATRRATRLSRRNCAVGGRLQLQRPVPGIDPVGPSRHAPKAVGPHLGSLEHRTCSGPECRSSGWRRCGRRDAGCMRFARRFDHGGRCPLRENLAAAEDLVSPGSVCIPRGSSRLSAQVVNFRAAPCSVSRAVDTPRTPRRHSDHRATPLTTASAPIRLCTSHRLAHPRWMSKT